MKILRKAKVEAVTLGEGPYVRVQALGMGARGAGAAAEQLYFSVAADQAPKPGQLIEFWLEWDGP